MTDTHSSPEHESRWKSLFQKEYRMDCDCSLDLAHSLLEVVGMTPKRFHNGGDQR